VLLDVQVTDAEEACQRLVNMTEGKKFYAAERIAVEYINMLREEVSGAGPNSNLSTAFERVDAVYRHVEVAQRLRAASDADGATHEEDGGGKEKKGKRNSKKRQGAETTYAAKDGKKDTTKGKKAADPSAKKALAFGADSWAPNSSGEVCKHYVRHGTCMHKEQCVHKHPSDRSKEDSKDVRE
jgi:hypothetical protein